MALVLYKLNLAESFRKHATILPLNNYALRTLLLPSGCFLPSQAAMTNDDNFHLSCFDLDQHSSSCKYYYSDHHIFPSRSLNSLFLLQFFLAERSTNIFCTPPEIICISETWLKLM